MSSKSILGVLIWEGRLHFSLLSSMSLVLISKECICVCLRKLGICTIFRLPDFQPDSAVVFISIALCHILVWLHVSTRYSPYQFLTRPVEGLYSTPLLFCCTTVLELSLQCTGFYSSKAWLLSIPHISCLSAYLLPGMWHRCLTTSDVFLFSCRSGHLEVVRLLLEFKVNPGCADKRGQTPLLLAL